MKAAMHWLVLAILMPFFALTPHATACHPDRQPPQPLILELPGGFTAYAGANASNGGYSHQPRATVCWDLARQDADPTCQHIQ